MLGPQASCPFGRSTRSRRYVALWQIRQSTFSSWAGVASAEGFRPRPAWHAEHPFAMTLPSAFWTRAIQLIAGLVQKSFETLILPSFAPPALTRFGASAFYW